MRRPERMASLLGAAGSESDGHHAPANEWSRFPTPLKRNRPVLLRWRSAPKRFLIQQFLAIVFPINALFLPMGEVRPTIAFQIPEFQRSDFVTPETKFRFLNRDPRQAWFLLQFVYEKHSPVRNNFEGKRRLRGQRFPESKASQAVRKEPSQ